MTSEAEWFERSKRLALPPTGGVGIFQLELPGPHPQTETKVIRVLAVEKDPGQLRLDKLIAIAHLPSSHLA